MKLPPIHFTQKSAYAVLCAGLAIALGACATEPGASPSRQRTILSQAGQGKPPQNIQLAQNEADDNEEYLGAATPSKQEWLDMLKSPGLTRGIRPVVKPRSLDVPFAKDSAELTRQARQQLEPLRQALADEILKNQTFVIEGHTDSAGSAAHNLWLSEQRAISVKIFLTENTRIEKQRIIPVGLGEDHPLPGHSPTDPINRRVKIRPSR